MAHGKGWQAFQQADQWQYDASWARTGRKWNSTQKYSGKQANGSQDSYVAANRTNKDTVTFARGSGYVRVNEALQTCDVGLKKADRFDVLGRLRTGVAGIRKKLEKKHVGIVGDVASSLSVCVRGDGTAQDDSHLCMCINTSSCPPSIFHEAVELFDSFMKKIYTQYDEWLISHGWSPEHLVPHDFSYEPFTGSVQQNRPERLVITPQEASRWEELVVVKKEARSVKIAMAAQSMTNEIVVRWCSWFCKHCDKNFGKDCEPIVAKRVDFSSNKLQATGISKLLETLSARNVSTQVLMLHHNQLEEGSPVASYLSFCAGALRELHLSHNWLDTAGAADIILAAAKLRSAQGPVNRPSFAYPWHTAASGSMVPLWLRIEQNYIDNAQLHEVMRPAIKRLKGRGEVLCNAAGSRCTPQWCCKTFDQPPAVHAKNLGAQGNQRSSERPVEVSSNKEDKTQKAAPIPSAKDNAADVVDLLAAAGAPTQKWRVKSAPQETDPEEAEQDQEQNVEELVTPREDESDYDADGTTLSHPNRFSRRMGGDQPPKSPIALAEAVGEDEDAWFESDNVVEAIKAGEKHLRAWLSKFLRTPEDDARVTETLESIEAVIKKGIENPEEWKVEVFGSVVAGFGTRGCDVDVVVYEVKPQGSARGEIETRTLLLRLSKLLEDAGFVVKEQIMSARVPVLKLQYKEQEVDLSINNIAPLLNTRLLKSFASLDPLVVELVVVIKLWAKHKRLCGAVDGHLSSYAFALMVIYFLIVASSTKMPCLQQQEGVTNENFASAEAAEALAEAARRDWSLEGQSLFMLVCGFFAFYTGTPGPGAQFYDAPFNWNEEVISVRLGSRDHASCEEFKELRGCKEMQLHIEDPFERPRNLRDVMTRDTETILWEQIAWMDNLCRHICTMEAGTPPFSPEMMPFPMPWFPMPGPWGPLPLMPPLEMLPEAEPEKPFGNGKGGKHGKGHQPEAHTGKASKGQYPARRLSGKKGRKGGKGK
jgi:hypothetical protein